MFVTFYFEPSKVSLLKELASSRKQVSLILIGKVQVFKTVQGKKTGLHMAKITTGNGRSFRPWFIGEHWWKTIFIEGLKGSKINISAIKLFEN